MKLISATSILCLLATLSFTGCSSTPEAKVDRNNSADVQKANARKAQDELSRETSR